MKKILLYILLVTLCTWASLLARPFTILSTIAPPYKYVDKNNKPTGLHVDVWMIIFNELGIDYKFQFVGWSSKKVKLEIEKGSFEMHFSLSKNVERLKWYIYPEESYLTHTYNFFIRAEDKNRIQYETFDDLKELRVGATESYSYTKEFWEAGLLLDVIVYKDLQLRKLIYKRIDTVPLKMLNALYVLKKEGNLDKIYILPKPLTEKSNYNAIAKATVQSDKPCISSTYDPIKKKIKKDGTLKKIYEKYFGSDIKIKFD